MLKDFFKKRNNNSSLNDKIISSLMDGYVDIKAYRYLDDSTKKLVYHDTGDNTVTNWMRQVIVMLLAGVQYTTSNTNFDAEQNSGETNYARKNIINRTFVADNHKAGNNIDGTIISDTNFQYTSDGSEYSTSYWKDENRKYALFPTKVLLGTGKEYTSWQELREENEEVNAAWYNEIIEAYGSGNGSEQSEEQFDALAKQKIGVNNYSGTYGAQNNYTGSGKMIPAVTVNDPNATTLDDTPANLANRYGVVGAIKTLYLPGGGDLEGGITSDDILNPITSESGRLIKPRYRGVGRPCFIYFNRTKDSDVGNDKYDWDKQTACVYVSRENRGGENNAFLNRITFKIVMPSQRGSGFNSLYYPYNGYTLKQIGLFNDSLIEDSEGFANSLLADKMPYGTLLAIKNIASFTKTADEEIVFTWTLTI